MHYNYVPWYDAAPKEVGSDISEARILTQGRRHQANAITFEPSIINNPKTVSEAKIQPDLPVWKVAIDTEKDNCDRHQVWEIVPKPSHIKELDTTWVLKSKYNANGLFVKKKARLCVRGFQQVEGIDYDDTSSPTGRLATLCILLGLVASFDLALHQMDVRCAFLNGEPEELIFIKKPKETNLHVPPGYGIRLRKSLYGLKRSPRYLYTALTSFFSSLNFSPSGVNLCFFIHNNPQKLCLVYIHVDDLVIGGNEKDVMEFKENMKSQFEMEDLGECKWVLGMRVTRNRWARTIQLHQDQYIENMLAEFGMENCKPATTPLPQKPARVPSSDTPVDNNFSFCRGVGLLNYLVQCTRPDLSFSWSYLFQFLNKHTITHQSQFFHLLGYLKHTKGLGITLGGNIADAFSLKAYCNADHASSRD